MARNYEKNFGQLNRLWLQQECDKQVRPRRPRLAELNNAVDIQKWLPSIKEEIEYCLMQSQVPCYTERKVKEFNERVIKLEIEYKRFLKKAKSLDSGRSFTIGMRRPYERRRKDKICDIPIPKVISLPVLVETGNEIVDCESQEVHQTFQSSDQPLQFEQKTSLINDTTSKRIGNQAIVKPNALGLSYSSSDDET